MTARGRRPHVAVLAGATGLVGTHLLRLLLAAPELTQVYALARRPLPPAPRLTVCAADFDRLEHALSGVPSPAQIDVYCALGTTLKRADSAAAFRAVDHDAVFALGRWARAHAARHLPVVSALGADAASRVFYNRVKGETEQALRALGLRTLVLARPSLLDGERAEQRPGERAALLLARPFGRLLSASVRPIAAADVAAALLLAARSDDPPAVLTSAAMQGAAARLG
jgi:uncharacterized protein YbjT (DUF2867 family)